MASNPLKRVRGHLIFCGFFWLWWSGVFAGVFREIGCANVVFLRGKRGGVVVICVANFGGEFWVGDGTGVGGLFLWLGERLAALAINARQDQRQRQIQGSFTAFRMTTFCGGRLWWVRLGVFAIGLADSEHGGAEEGFEVLGGGGVFCYGGFDGFLRHGAGVAEVDQSG